MRKVFIKDENTSPIDFLKENILYLQGQRIYLDKVIFYEIVVDCIAQAGKFNKIRQNANNKSYLSSILVFPNPTKENPKGTMTVTVVTNEKAKDPDRKHLLKEVKSDDFCYKIPLIGLSKISLNRKGKPMTKESEYGKE